MFSNKKIVIIVSALVIIPMIALISVKYYMHYQVKVAVENMLLKNDSLSFNYQTILTSFGGKVTFLAPHLFIKSISERFSADKLIIETGSLQKLLEFNDLLNKDALSKTLIISAKALKFSNEAYFELFDYQFPLAKTPALKCINRVDEKIFNKINITDIHLDTKLGFEFTEDDRLQIIFDLDIRHLHRHNIKMSVKYAKRSKKEMLKLLNKNNALPKFRYHFKNTKSITKILNECAEQLALSESDIIKELTSMSQQEYFETIGFYPSEQLRESFQYFLSRSPHTFQLTFNPNEDILYSELSTLSHSNLISRADIKLQINDESIDDIHYVVPSTQQRLHINNQLATFYNSKKKKKPLNKKRVAVRYRRIEIDVPLNQLHFHLDKRVWVHVKNGSIREGILKDLNSETVRMKFYYKGGTTDYNIAKKDIIKITTMKKIKR